jgi:catechol 2,3-dioxygenase-like lactoylglutathione lyase family enzyme
VEFYRDVLGMQVEWEPDPDNVYLTSGSDNLAIHRLPDGAEPGAVQSIHHIGFIVARLEDVDAWPPELKVGYRDGLPSNPRDGARSFYFRDPDGFSQGSHHHPAEISGELAK